MRRSDWLTWLAGKANIEYVADYYSQASHPMTETQKAAELKRPLKVELDAQAVPEQ